MLRVFKILASDAAQASRHLLSGVFLLSGFNVCIATGALVTGFALQDFESGLEHFTSVMGFAGVPLIAPMPEIFAVLNWTALGAMILFAGYSTCLYFFEAARRSQPTARIVQFPLKDNSVVAEASKQVANL